MAKVTRDIVEESGIDVDQLLELLVKNASAEITTYYYYTILRANLIGLQGEGLKEIAEVARIEDRNHFEALIPRIYELGGKLPDDMKGIFSINRGKPQLLIFHRVSRQSRRVGNIGGESPIISMPDPPGGTILWPLIPRPSQLEFICSLGN